MTNRSGRFYIGKEEIEDGGLEVWIADRVLAAMPPGQICECDVHDDHRGEDYEGNCADPSTSYSYRIDADHVCYTYLCEPCAEATTTDDYLADYGYPQTAGGYAVVPRHCA